MPDNTEPTADVPDLDQKVPKLSAAPKLPRLAEGVDLGQAVAVHPVRLTNISLGKPVANVSALLTLNVLTADFDARRRLGEHSYAAVFVTEDGQEGFLGEGIIIKEAPFSSDEENNLHQSIKMRVPRFVDAETDQILRSIAPFVGGSKVLKPLLELGWTWRLNVPCDIPGTLRLYDMQQGFGLLPE